MAKAVSQRKRASTSKKTTSKKKTASKVPAKASRRQVVNVPKEFTFAETARILREFMDAMRVCETDSSKADIKKAAKVLDDLSPLARALCVRVSNPKRVNDHFDGIDKAISQCEKLSRYERHDLFRKTGYQWAQWLALSQDIASFKYHHGDSDYSARCYLEQYAAHAEHSANIVIERFGDYDMRQDAEPVVYEVDDLKPKRKAKKKKKKKKKVIGTFYTGWAVAPELGALAMAIRPSINPDRPLQRATQSLPRDATYVETVARLERVDNAVEAVVEFVRHYEGGKYIFSDIQQELSNAIQAARLVVPDNSDSNSKEKTPADTPAPAGYTLSTARAVDLYQVERAKLYSDRKAGVIHSRQNEGRTAKHWFNGEELERVYGLRNPNKTG